MGLASYSTRRRDRIPILYERYTSDKINKKNLQLTVCGGGTLEWPPEVETLTQVSTRPFSAMPGIAMTVPPMSRYAPTRAIRSNHSFRCDYSTHCPHPPIARTNLGRTFLTRRQRDVWHPINNRAELTFLAVEKLSR